MTEWMNLVGSSLCLCIIVFLEASSFTLVGYQARREKCEANSNQCNAGYMPPMHSLFHDSKFNAYGQSRNKVTL